MTESNDWIKCSENVPYDKKVGADYNWVLVTSERFGTGEPWPFAIARYTLNGWELYDYEEDISPCFGDGTSILYKEDITHWMRIKSPY